jgi:hypothetical protein
MDTILEIPLERKKLSPVRLCLIMGLTALVLLLY